MCNTECIIWGLKNITEVDIREKRVIEVGSRDVNGSLRYAIELLQPAEYIGVDIINGRGVDLLCPAEELVKTFGEKSFDVIISTDLLEHARNWREVISNLKRICKPKGIMLLTTCSRGFGYHGYPYDFWRFEVKDLSNIFSDCNILRLDAHPKTSDVFIKVQKPNKFVEKTLPNYELHSIITNRRVKDIKNKDFWTLRYATLTLKEQFRRLILKIGTQIYHNVYSIPTQNDK